MMSEPMNEVSSFLSLLVLIFVGKAVFLLQVQLSFDSSGLGICLFFKENKKQVYVLLNYPRQLNVK